MAADDKIYERLLVKCVHRHSANSGRSKNTTGIHKTNDVTHEAMIIYRTFFVVIIARYANGRVTAMKRSTVITTKLYMDAVHNHTSMANHTRHKTEPNTQTSNVCVTVDKGKTNNPNVKSDAANDNMNKLPFDERKFLLTATMQMTIKFALMTTTLRINKMITVA